MCMIHQPILHDQGRSACLSLEDHPQENAAEAPWGVEDELVRTFAGLRGKLSRKLHTILGNSTDVQDALQIAFLHCWRARAVVRRIGNLRAWIWRVSVNAGLDLQRYLRRQRTRPLTTSGANAVCRYTSAAERLLKQEESECLQAALVHLRPAEREVFLLRQQEGLRFTEIAKRCDCPVGTAKPLMTSAMRKLRKMLVPEAAAASTK